MGEEEIFVFKHQKLNELPRQLFLDYDFYKRPLNKFSPEQAYELVKRDALALRDKFDLGKMVVLRTERGVMVKFPQSRLTKDEFVRALSESKLVDEGFRHWSIRKGYATLRRGEKVVLITDKEGKVSKRRIEPRPEVVEIL